MSDSITITGNIATVPEHRRTPAGVAITTFRVASAQRRYDRSAGAWVDAGTNWYTVSAFRSLADHAAPSRRKGDRVLLTGRLRLRAWENGGKKGLAVEIDAEAVGHDLLWGTTTFVKDGLSVAPAGEESWDTAAPGSGAWTAPGVEATPEASGPTADADAGAPAGAADLASVGAPF